MERDAALRHDIWFSRYLTLEPMSGLLLSEACIATVRLLRRTETSISVGSREKAMDDGINRGNLPANLISLSRLMAKILRHETELEDCKDCGGWVPLDMLLRHPEMRNITLPDLRVVVEESYSRDRKRFELQLREDAQWIRATHRHSVSGYVDSCGHRPDKAPGCPVMRGANPWAQSGDPWPQMLSNWTSSTPKTKAMPRPQVAMAKPAPQRIVDVFNIADSHNVDVSLPSMPTPPSRPPPPSSPEQSTARSHSPNVDGRKSHS